MTVQEIKIAKKILDYLHGLDSGKAHALTVHSEIGGLIFCGAAQFDDVMRQLETRRLIFRVPTRFTGDMWIISDDGEAARLQMA